jgi:hypothetical protein
MYPSPFFSQVKVMWLHSWWWVYHDPGGFAIISWINISCAILWVASHYIHMSSCTKNISVLPDSLNNCARAIKIINHLHTYVTPHIFQPKAIHDGWANLVMWASKHSSNWDCSPVPQVIYAFYPRALAIHNYHYDSHYLCYCKLVILCHSAFTQCLPNSSQLSLWHLPSMLLHTSYLVPLPIFQHSAFCSVPSQLITTITMTPTIYATAH